MTTTNELKRLAGEYAVNYIQSGMIIGLGGGTTVIWAIRQIAKLIKSKDLDDIRCIPCSLHVEALARDLNIPLVSLEEYPQVDLTIDGADEVSPTLDLIKGGGGALLREKIVAQASKREIIVVDESKMSSALGLHYSVPVEVFPFGWKSQAEYLKSLGAEVTLRKNSDGSCSHSDQGNLILDCNFGSITYPHELSAKINIRAGIIEHGLFIGHADKVVVSGETGIQVLTKDS